MVGRGYPNCQSEEAGYDELWDNLGGHPFLTEMVLCRAWDCGSLQAGLGDAAGEIYGHYEHLRELITEDGLLDQLLQLAVGPSWSVQPTAERLLQDYGLLKVEMCGATHIRNSFCDSFQVYLEKISRELPVWSVWNEVETGLRDVIESRLLQLLGESWFKLLAKRHPKAIGPILDSSQYRQSKEMKNFGTHASDRLVDFTYPMELWTIMACEWSTFQQVLKRDKRYWEERFKAITVVRNPSAHNRERYIPPQNMLVAKGYCMELKSLLAGLPQDMEQQ